MVINKYKIPSGASYVLQCDSYSGKINQVKPTETTPPFRNGIIKAQPQIYWDCQQKDDICVAWFNLLYFSLYPNGPIYNGITAGSYINFPQVEFSKFNNWGELYYGENWKRLLECKKQLDPNNIFKHALSIPVTNE